MADDPVDHIIEQWRRTRPDLDPSAKAVTGRVVRASDAMRRRFTAAFEPLGLKPGDYSALVALRRAGERAQLTPSQLQRELMITSGGMTLQLDRLERDGLVRRRPNPGDRRGVLVSLTRAGRTTIDEAMTIHAAAEQRLIGSLTARERKDLARLLAKLLRDIDDR